MRLTGSPSWKTGPPSWSGDCSPSPAGRARRVGQRRHARRPPPRDAARLLPPPARPTTAAASWRYEAGTPPAVTADDGALARPAIGRLTSQRDGVTRPGTTAGGRVPDGRTEALISHGRQRARRSPGAGCCGTGGCSRSAAVALLAGSVAALVVSAAGAPAGRRAWPGAGGDQAGVREPGRRGGAERAQLRVREGLAAGAVGILAAHQRRQPRVTWTRDGPQGPGADPARAGRRHRLVAQPAPPVQPGERVDSLEVAARAINNIIAGATLTSTSGGALVEPGLESTAADCQRYTGSARAGDPVRATRRAAPPRSPRRGEAALVGDAFAQWMGGTPSQIAARGRACCSRTRTTQATRRSRRYCNSLPASGR